MGKIYDLDVSLETSLLLNYKTKVGGTGSFSDTEFCPLSAVMGGEFMFMFRVHVSQMRQVTQNNVQSN